MSTAYKLTTLQDVYDKVPADRIALCMREIAEGMQQAKAIDALLADCGAPAALKGIEWEWSDDDLGSVSLDVTDMAGKPILTAAKTRNTQEKD